MVTTETKLLGMTVKEAKRLAPKDHLATSEVGAYPQDKSPFGCYDMSGNVREWTLDIPYVYEGSNEILPKVSQERRVFRGGSWLHEDVDFFKCSLNNF